jgi:hypothetical protein
MIIFFNKNNSECEREREREKKSCFDKIQQILMSVSVMFNRKRWEKYVGWLN